jgi:hypothetical protein
MNGTMVVIAERYYGCCGRGPNQIQTGRGVHFDSAKNDEKIPITHDTCAGIYLKKLSVMISAIQIDVCMLM